jgi:hypothetical protein
MVDSGTEEVMGIQQEGLSHTLDSGQIFLFVYYFKATSRMGLFVRLGI